MDLSPSLQIASQSRLDCSDAAGEVSSMYSTPKSERAVAILILVSVSKKAFANWLIDRISVFDERNFRYRQECR